MMKINDITQLNAEIAKLKIQVKLQEEGLLADINNFKESMKPANLLGNGLSSLTGVKITGNELLKDGMAYGLVLLLQRFVSKSEKKMEHKVAEFVDGLVERLKNIFEKFTNQEEKGNEGTEDKSSSV